MIIFFLWAGLGIIRNLDDPEVGDLLALFSQFHDIMLVLSKQDKRRLKLEASGWFFLQFPNALAFWKKGS